MQFGVSFLPDCREEWKSAAEYYSDALALCTLAESAGFASAKMTEHYLTDYGGYCPSPLNFLSAVAARTTRLRLITGCVLPAFHHPVQLAAEAAMVDAISGGRLEVGFARAYLPQEFETFGVSLDESTDRYRETIRAVLRLWTEERVDEETPYFSYRQATGRPSPVQRPHPPVWGAASMTPGSFQWLGGNGFGLLMTPSLNPAARMRPLVDLYRDAAAAAGHTPRIATSLPLILAETDAEAERLADRHIARYLEVWTEAVESWNGRESGDYRGYGDFGSKLAGVTPAYIREINGAIVGSPATAAERILRLVRDFGGVDQILWQVDIGAMPLAQARRSIEMFRASVVPLLREKLAALRTGARTRTTNAG
ncbi:LLM class flavin-dependent oxidoreductase [Streptomyces sp. NPDC090442]|uniref:LLM class flavin-dependent oxidoreductase n=1 Tax=Streptomyces sp. NPDC090442 TaxID=3365962 RepID=UPI0038225CA1